MQFVKNKAQRLPTASETRCEFPLFPLTRPSRFNYNLSNLWLEYRSKIDGLRQDFVVPIIESMIRTKLSKFHQVYDLNLTFYHLG